MFDEFLPLLEAEDFDYALAGARLLGYDMADIANGQALIELRRILRREADETGNLALARAMGRDVEEALKLIARVLMGTNDRVSHGEANA